MKEWAKKNGIKVWYSFLVILSIGRVVLSSGYVYEYIVNAGLDDQWMVSKEYFLLSGQWLGPYGQATLIKSVTYPIILACFRAASIPYGLGLGLIVVGISFVFSRSIRPIVQNDIYRGMIYLIVLFSPFGFLTLTTARIYRNSISHWLALFVIASYIGVYLRKDWPLKKIWKWIIACAISLGMFWELREDKIWIMAFVLPATIIIVIYWIYHKKKILNTIAVAVIPFAVIFLLEMSISTINYKCYGVFTTNDRSGTYCGKVMTLLYQIDDGQENDYRIWVSNDARDLAEEVSPTFKSLSEGLDNWWGYYSIETEFGTEVPGDHAEWALRQAVADGGYYVDGKSTNDFYKKIYDELSEGFKSGKLHKKDGIMLSSQMKSMQADDFKMAFDLTGPVLKKYITYDTPYDGVYVAYNRSWMEEENVSLFENLLLTRIIDFEENEDNYLIGNKVSSSYGLFNIKVHNAILKVYKNVIKVLNYIVILLLVFLISNVVIELRKKEYYSFNAALLIIGLILLLFVYTFLIVIWALWMNTDPNSSVYWFYGSPAPMIVTIIRILCMIYGVTRIKQIIINKRSR